MNGSGDNREEPPVGSVGEEAAKLFDALQDWVKDTGTAAGAAAGAAGGAGGAPGAGAAGGPLGGLGEQWRLVNDHLANGGKDCTYCPVCQVIGKVREASPEVRTHLAVATSSLLQAAAMLVEARGARARPAEHKVTKIDLDDDLDPDPNA